MMQVKLHYKKNVFIVLLSYLTIWSILYYLLPIYISKDYKQISIFDILRVHKYQIDFLNDKYFWLTPIGIFIKFFLEIIFTTCIFNIGMKVLNYKVHFKLLILIVIISHSIFLAQYILEFLYLKINWDNIKDLKKEDFSLFSISYFLYIFKINYNYSLKYCFQIFNLFEIIYWLILTRFLSKYFSIRKIYSFNLVLFCYVLPFILWVLLITLLKTIL